MSARPPKTALITGITGFVGHHLARACLARGWQVVGTVRSFRTQTERLQAAFKHARPELRLVPCDITDATQVQDAVRAAAPHYAFHLAAQSYVPESWGAPDKTLTVNAQGTLHLLEAVRRHAPQAVVQVAGTSEEYGMVKPRECPITEDQPLRPLSPYGVSKAAADLLARQYHASYGLKVVVTRAFNHSGSGRGSVFAESDWARQLALAAAGKGPRAVRHGHLGAVRDYTHVRDVVDGYVAAVQEPRLYGQAVNLCSGPGSALTMASVLRRLVRLSGLGVRLEAERSRMRPSDVPRLVGDARKARALMGWRPTLSVDKMLQDLLDYWVQEVKAI